MATKPRGRKSKTGEYMTGDYLLKRMESGQERLLTEKDYEKEVENPRGVSTSEMKQMEKDAKALKERAEKKGTIQLRYNLEKEQYEKSKDNGKTWESVQKFHKKVDELMKQLSDIGVHGKGGKRRKRRRTKKKRKRRRTKKKRKRRRTKKKRKRRRKRRRTRR